MNRELTYLPCGDNAVMIKVKDEISEEVHNHVRMICYKIENSSFSEVLEIIPSYGSILVIYDPLKISYMNLVNKFKNELISLRDMNIQPPEVVHIPVCYDLEFGFDLQFVSQHNGLEPSEIINIHSSKPYLIYMIGFLPGFPYLGGMSEKIAAPRLESPRLKIPAGSVGIAGMQTGIYPSESPGGWRIIGRTPLKLFNPLKEVPVLLKPSQYIKFEPITRDEFYEIREKDSERCYKIKISNLLHENK